MENVEQKQQQQELVVDLPDGFCGRTQKFYAVPVETDGHLVKLRCAEAGSEYLTAWKRADEVSAAVMQRKLEKDHGAVVNRLSGAMVRRLMRNHHVTIQGLSERFRITKKRVREVRARGVTGFNASEWHYMISGRWLDAHASH